MCIHVKKNLKVLPVVFPSALISEYSSVHRPHADPISVVISNCVFIATVLIFWVPPILGNYSIFKLFPTRGSNERSVLDIFDGIWCS